MCVPVPTAQKIRFGVFELDRQSAELFKHGAKLKLQGQPIAVLTLLLERPGELVTREEIRKHLWPEDTFVDFEHSLNTHIKKLRQVFADDAETPRYIETLPRRGYRFIAQVETGTNGGGVVAGAGNVGTSHPTEAETHTTLQEPARSPTPSPSLLNDAACGPTPPKRYRWQFATSVAIVLAIAGGLFYLSFRPRTPVVTATRQLTYTGRQKQGYVVTDGTRVYFNEIKDEKPHVAQVSTAGGEVSYLDTQVDNSAVQDLSSDGSELMLSTPHENWILPLPAGPPRRIPGEYSGIGFLPGGSQIAYVQPSDFLHLFAADADGGNAHSLLQLPRDPATIYFLFSPDGSTIRYRTADGKFWESRIDGTQKHLLSQGFYDAGCMDWSAGNKLFLWSSPEEGTFNVWAISQSSWPRGLKPQPVQLTFGPVSFECVVASKDGKHIYARGRTRRGELSIYDTQAGMFHKYLAGISAGSTDFSPDGQWVAYVTHPQGNLWRSRVDGSERRQLTFAPMGPVLGPKWSPDGRYVAFMERRPPKAKIYLVGTDGGAPMLLPTGDFGPADPTWSGDGRFLAYSGGVPWMSADPKETRSEIRILDLSTKQSKTVPGSQGMFSPRWSPDGHYLVALSDDQMRLYLYSFENQQWQQLPLPKLSKPDRVSYPNWSHDSRYLYFLSVADSGIYKLSVPGGQPELVVSVAGIDTATPAMPWSGWFGLTPDDHILMMLDRGVDEIYALDVEYR